MIKSTFQVILFLIAHISGFSQISCEKLFDCFKQGERPNCASIALIKASLNIYGLDNLFQTGKITDTSYSFILKNGKTLVLTDTEIVQAKQSADFVLLTDNAENRKILEYSILAYAVMAKNKQIIDKEPDFTTALGNLEYGAYTPRVYKYLGFEKGKQVVNLRRLSGGNYSGVVAWSSAHAVYACEGYMDYHGNKNPLWFKYSGRFRIIK